MAAVQHNNLVSGGRRVRKGKDIRERKTFVAATRVRRQQIAARCLDVTMSGEVEERDLGRRLEQLGDAILEDVPIHLVARPSPVRTERSIRFGDVIVFDRDGQMVCHRVVRIRRGPLGCEFVTKGDPVPGFDEPVPGTALLGRVIRIKRPGGELQMDTRWGRWSNQAQAAASLAAGYLYGLFPWKGAFRGTGWPARGARYVLHLPSQLVRILGERRAGRRR